MSRAAARNHDRHYRLLQARRRAEREYQAAADRRAERAMARTRPILIDAPGIEAAATAPIRVIPALQGIRVIRVIRSLSSPPSGAGAPPR